MAARYLNVSENGGVIVVQFLPPRIDDANIEPIDLELRQVLEDHGNKCVLLSFSNVEFVDAAALGRLVIFSIGVIKKSLTGKLKLCNIRPEMYDVLKDTRLNRLVKIYVDDAEALAAFGADARCP
ncbi:MAG: STAS domain-containing protein [Pirellulales bacterium]